MKNILKKSVIVLAVLLTNAYAEDKPLKIAMATETYPPHFFYDEEDEKVGFELDVVQELCKRLNRECQLKEDNFSKLIPSLRFKKTDLIISAMTDNAYRRRVIDFSDTYYDERVHLAVNRHSKAHHNFCENCPKVLDLGKKADKALFKKELLKHFSKRKIAVTKGTTADNFLTENAELGRNINIVYVDTLEGMKLLQQNRVDAVLPITQGVVSQHPEIGDVRLVSQEITGGFFGYGIAIGVRRSEAQLKQQINEVISNMRTDGSLAKLQQKWFK